MYATLLCLAIAANPPVNTNQNRTTDQPRAGTATTASLDGTWTIVCLEKDGQPASDAKGKSIMVKDGTFTCTGKDGKPGMTWKVDFADKGQVSISEIANDSGSRIDNPEKKSGVYVLTSDYLAVCMHNDSGTGREATNAAKDTNKCTIIMKREGSGK